MVNVKKELSFEDYGMLEDLVLDNVYYLIIKQLPKKKDNTEEAKEDTEKPEDEEVEVYYRFQYPNHNQKMEANKQKSRFYNEIVQDKGLRSKREIEEQFKEEIADIKKKCSPLEKDIKRLNEKLFIDGTTLPDPEKEPAKFNTLFNEYYAPLLEVQKKIEDIRRPLLDIYSLSYDFLAEQEHMAIMTSLCWEKPVDDDNWVPIWKDYNEYKDDRKPLATFLLNKTTAFFAGMGSFFGG